MPRKKLSAEAENPMDNVAMETESGSAWPDGESGAEALGQGTEYNALPLNQDEMDGDEGGLQPDAPPGDGGGNPLSDGDGPYSGGLPPDGNGLSPNGTASEWEADSGGYVDASPDGMGVSPDALSAVLEGVDVPMRGSNPDKDIPGGEDAPEDNPRPPDGSLSGAAETGDDNGGTLTEPVPPVAAERPRRRRIAADTDASRARSRAADRTASGFHAPAPIPTAPSSSPSASEQRRVRRPPSGVGAERAAFFGLQFNKLDRGLTPEQQQEWNSIYASYRGGSVMTGTITGVEDANLLFPNRETGVPEERMGLVAVVIPYRVRILIPETEMWYPGEERPSYVMNSLGGAKVDFVIIGVNREEGFATASRTRTLPHRRYYFSTQPGLNRPGSRIQCSMMAVGHRRCLVNCNGYDLSLTQRDLSWNPIPNLKDVYHTGDTLDCIVKEYDSRKNYLVVSVKEATPNPFDGAEFRHPEGCRRTAVITGKYGGGVFCTFPDDVTTMCNYAFQYDDSEFKIGDRVIVKVERYLNEKKQIHGKILARH